MWLLHWSNSQHRNNFIKWNAFKLEWWHEQSNMFHDSAFQHEMNNWGKVGPHLGPGVPHCLHTFLIRHHSLCALQHQFTTHNGNKFSMMVGTLHKLPFKEPPRNICIHHNFQWKLCFLYQSKVLRSKLLILVNFANFFGERMHCSLRNKLDICSSTSVIKGHIWR